MANIIRINGLDREELDVYVRLTGPQLRHATEYKEGIFIAESPTVIEVALESGAVPISFLTDERLLRGELMELMERMPEVPVYVSDKETLRAITGFELTRGALCAMRRPRELTLAEVLTEARRIAVLEEIADSTNVGAIFRCAAALGIDAVLLTPTCCDPLCRRAVRVSMGTVLKVPFARVGTSPEQWREGGIDILHEYGFKSVAMALSSDSVSLDSEMLASEGRLAIILGTEGTGLMEETISKSDYVAKIPMARGVDSLNVACASAIAFYQLTKK